MHGLQLLHKILLKSCFQIHIDRLASLVSATQGLLSGSKLTLVNIGRHLEGSQLVKHKIKQIDRLLGNENFYAERRAIYHCLTSLSLSPSSRPVILIDWSGVMHCGAFHMIRAGIAHNGRTLTIYEEVYPEKLKDSPKANQAFLQNLAKILPIGCCPIIVTAAGYRNPWYREVLRLGWDFVGRVRNKTQVCKKEQNSWEICKKLYKTATLKAQYIGEFFLAKSNPLLCRMYAIKQKPKYRKKKNLKGHNVRCHQV